MPKTTPKELDFPAWSETSKYGINTLQVGDTVKLHFHDAHEYWVIIKGKGMATSEGITYELEPGDMLMTKCGRRALFDCHRRNGSRLLLWGDAARRSFWVSLSRRRSRFRGMAETEREQVAD
jgi:hypothetical protein